MTPISISAVSTNSTAGSFSTSLLFRRLFDSIALVWFGVADRTLLGRIVQYQTSGSKKIDEIGLTHSGGGSIAVSQEMMAVENFFEVVVEIDQIADPGLADAMKLGMSAILSLPSTDQTLWSIIYRRSMRVLNQFRLAAL